MKRTKFLVSSLLAAGFSGQQDALAQAFSKATMRAIDDPQGGALLRRFSQDHAITLAQHRSHSSHSSHRSGGGGGGHYSHTSHRSSSGGGYSPSYDTTPTYSAPYVAPAPTPSAPAEPTPSVQPLFARETRAAAPPPDGLPALSGRTKRFTSIVRRVQIALMAQDLYSGAVDGVVGPALRSALRKFQKARGLDVTGTITPPTLDALMVSSG
ncbi:peptidoglycan-binding protein [Sphingomonas sp. PP-CE-1G-424]|uniref:peptidoglycan-binding protein n=1 Tax=Sphingomonas sp. PP-CE-1G-424 TaxID=2135658 RepID=UPI001054EE66|nr:peptidoglycan-binding protein [Sphingomonas sp. PP-CE-1G-424]